MRITTKAVFDMKTGRLLHWEGYEYDGPVALCGGGPTDAQNAAAQSQANLTAQTAASAASRDARENQQYNLIKPYATSRINNGLPFFNALTDYNSAANAAGYAPARAAIMRRTSSFGDLPSGFKEGMLNDLEAGRARDFDSRQISNLFANEQAKSEAARLITNQQQIANPLGFYGQAMQGNSSIMNAPLQSPGLQGLIGGAIGGAASAIPF